MDLTSRTTLAGAALLTLAAATLTLTTDAHAATTISTSAAVDIGSRTGFATGSGVAIGDTAVGTVQPAGPYPSAVLIDGTVGQITDVDVALEDLSHGAGGDVDVMLVSPAGTAVMLLSDALNGPVGPVSLVFDDEATGQWTASGLQSGAYPPRDVDAILGEDVFPAPAPAASSAGSHLSAFDGQAADGQWTLYVVDDQHGDSGGIGSWELSVTTTGMTGSPSTIQVAGVAGPVTGVRVGLHHLSHTHSGDVDVMLVGPGGQQVTLLSDVGTATSVTDADLLFSDQAPTEAGPALVSGTFRPTNLEGVATDFYGPAPAPGPSLTTSLAVLAGTDPNGTWRLYLGDDRAYGDRGTLGGWRLEIDTPGGPVVVTPTTPQPTPQPTPADTVAPRVVSSRPAAAASGVRRSVTVTARLSEPVAPASVTRRSAYLVAHGATRPVRAVVRYAAGAVTVDPKARLAAHTRYLVVLTSGIRDLAGNRLSRTTWRFTTR